jgi:salicylate hydroxylase
LGKAGSWPYEDSYVIAACLKKHFTDPANAMARYEDIRRERTSAVVRKSHENRKQGRSRVSVAKNWQQTLARERLDWLFTYDATAIQICRGTQK